MPLNGASASMEYQKDVKIADACQREVTLAVSPEPLAQLVGTVLCRSLSGLQVRAVPLWHEDVVPPHAVGSWVAG